MAGRARTKALTEELEQRTRDYFQPEDGESPTVLEYICARVENTATIKAIAKELSDTLNHEVTYDRIMALLRATYGDAATETALDLARTRASHCYAEESIEIVDAPTTDKTEVSRAASRARSRQWVAERWNRKGYGQDKGVSVTMTIGSLHLDALRAPSPIVTGTPQAALQAPSITQPDSAQVVEYEVVS